MIHNFYRIILDHLKHPAWVACVFSFMFCLTVPLFADSPKADKKQPVVQQQENQKQKTETDNNQKLLERYYQLADQFAKFRQQFHDSIRLDRMAMIELMVTLQKDQDLLTDTLVNNLKKQPQSTDEYKNLQERVIAILNDQIQIIQSSIHLIQQKVSHIQKEGIQDKFIEEKQLQRWLMLRFENLLDHEMSLLVAHIQRLDQLNARQDEQIDQLQALLTQRSIELSGRVSLAVDTINMLKEWINFADQQEQRNIEKKLFFIEFYNKKAISSLSLTVEMMKKMGMETSQFGKLLVIATGEILNKTVDTKVAIDLVTKITRNMQIWLDDNLSVLLFKAISVILILMVFHFLARLVSKLVLKLATRSQVKSSKLLNSFLQMITARLVLFLGLLIAMSHIGIELAPLLAGMGIMGFIAGFALQDSLSNFSSGMMILINQPFDIDDVVEAGGTYGIVRKMNLVSTTILTFDNQELVVPNNKIWGDIIRNVSSQTQRRVDLSIPLAHHIEFERAEALFKQILAEDPRILPEPAPNVRLNRIGEYQSEFIIRPWVKTEDYWPVYWDLLRTIKQRMNDEKMDFPHQKQDVYIHRG